MSRFGLVLPFPQGLEFKDWAARVCEQYADSGVQQPVEEAYWQDWARHLLAVPELAFIPDPSGFGSWREWASRAVGTNV